MRRQSLCLQFFLLTLLVLTLSPTSQAQYKPTDYVRTEAMIPMRDGVRLYTADRRSDKCQ